MASTGRFNRRLSWMSVLSESDEEPAAAALAELPDIAAVEPIDDGEGHSLIVFPHNSRSIIGSVTDLLHNHRWEPQALRVERGSLDDVFRQITTSH